MIKMADYEGMVPEELCTIDRDGGADDFVGCGRCFVGYGDDVADCEECVVNTIFQEYAKLTGQIMEEEMKAMQSGSWIPVSERLPSKLEEVLCCNVDGIQSIGYIRHRASGIECENRPFIMPDVVAWMPLPEPYAP